MFVFFATLKLMPSIKSLPLHLRPREKLIEKGPTGLTDTELLAIMLRTGRSGKSALELAKDIFKKYPLDNFPSLKLQNLKTIQGVDIGKSSTVIAAIELITRALGKVPRTQPVINSPQSALDQLSQFRNQKKEHFVALYLNARNELLKTEVISVGTLTRSLVHPREVFAPALTNLSASILVAHNHPSGDSDPSDDDIAITKRLSEASNLLGIALYDHLIITSSSYYSFREHGYLT